MKKQTAVEWLCNQVHTIKWRFADITERKSILEKAKEMEKQQIIDAYQTSHISMMTAEQYYNETYKNKEQ